MSNRLTQRHTPKAGGQLTSHEMMAASSESGAFSDFSRTFQTESLRARDRGSASRHLGLRPPSNRIQSDPANSVLAILSATALLEVALPWIVIWLSDAFLFDIPAWSVWPLLCVSPALGLLAVVVRFAWAACATHLSRPLATKSKRRVFAMLRHH